jgi:type II secretory pathway component GspD/PulD (secretin)
VETSSINSNALIDLNKEIIIGKWDLDQEVEQTIGVPFLSKIPILKYLFSTTTKQREVCHVILSVKAELLDTTIPVRETAGKLIKVK